LHSKVPAIEDGQDNNTMGDKKTLPTPDGAGGLHGRFRLSS
jgi:hypothetical protein